KGTIHLKIKLTPLPGEITQENNEKDVFIQVLDNRQKIYFVVNAPHPDAGAFRQSLEAGDNYQVKVVRASKAVDFNRSYDLLVLHNLPSDEFGVADLLKKATEFGTPVLYILGTQTSLNSFNALHSGLEITSGIRKYNSVQARVNPDFSLFQLDDATQQTIPAFPPLLTPFGKYTSTTNNYFLLTQKIGNVSSGDPLLLFNENGPVKTAVLCGEGIWRWRLSDFETTGNFNAINELLFKTVQNLCIKENRSKFRIIAKTSFNENEPVTLNAELYNDNFEPVNSPDVNIVLTDMGGKSFPYIFSKTEKAYNLNAGFFSPGNYKYKATAKLGEKVYAAEGEFTVVPLQAEQTESVADYHLLFSLAEKSGGNMYFPSQLDKLSRDLQQREDIRTVSYSRSKLQDLINLKWVFGLIMILLAAEWFLRKRAGSY
ncbi:MAG: hypothetical protein IT242_02445, partial [Bacteroidia bacterium]|nr:hypothetical protein [Bacteroidia bacterium]